MSRSLATATAVQGNRPSRAVLPAGLDGLRADWVLWDRPVQVTYRVGVKGHAPQQVKLNGQAVAGLRQPNLYRAGGLALPRHALQPLLRDEGNLLEVQLG